MSVCLHYTYHHDFISRIPEWTSEGKEVNIKLSLCLSTITGEYIRNMVWKVLPCHPVVLG